MRSSFQYDALGRQRRQLDYLGDGAQTNPAVSYDHQQSYNDKGRVTRDVVNQRAADNSTATTTADYSYGDGTAGYALGAALSVSTTKTGVANPVVTTNTYAWYDQAALAGTTNGDLTAATAYHYTALGTLAAIDIGTTGSGSGKRTIALANDAGGQAIARIDPAASVGGADRWYRFDGRQLGELSSHAVSDPGYTASVTNRSGGTTPTRIGHNDLRENYDAIDTPFARCNHFRCGRTLDIGQASSRDL